MEARDTGRQEQERHHGTGSPECKPAAALEVSVRVRRELGGESEGQVRAAGPARSRIHCFLQSRTRLEGLRGEELFKCEELKGKSVFTCSSQGSIRPVSRDARPFLSLQKVL